MESYYNIDNRTLMQKELQWHRIIYGNKSKEVPKQRWGHKIIKAGNCLLTFGGYGGVQQGQGKFLKDLWKFDLQSYEWEQVVTKGEMPSSRSNYTLHYYRKRNEVIMFGGGTDNKNRYNSICILDLASMVWREVFFDLSEDMPWERTYHTSQLFQHYLVVFGGEGVSNIDLNDTWAFDLDENKWINIQSKGYLPARRRFACSVLVGSDFYLIGGCRNYYEQIGDIHKLNLTPLKQGRVEDMEWETVIDQANILQRWGHITEVYQQKIYIFGGRINSSTDDSLFIEFDCKKGVLRRLETNGSTPQPRRRHSSVLLGDCLLVFGGYNGRYFNDFTFMKLPKQQPSSTINTYIPDKIRSNKAYKHFLSKQMQTSTDTLVATTQKSTIRVPICPQKLKQNSTYFKHALKYHNFIQIPNFCKEQIFKVVLLSISNKQLMVWSGQQIEECFEITQLLEYYCCQELLKQMEKYLIKRLNIKNAVKMFQKAVNFSMEELAESAAFLYLQSYQLPSENAEQNTSRSSISLSNNYYEFDNFNENMLNILVKVQDNLRFQIDQYHLRNHKKGFFKKTIDLFINIFCSRTQQQPEDNHQVSRKRNSRIFKVMMLAYRLCNKLGRRQVPKP